MQVTMTVNGESMTREVEDRMLLVHFLRDELALTGTHWGCDTSNCGTCVVLVDGEPVKSCTQLAAMTVGHDVRTVEGLADGATLDQALALEQLAQSLCRQTDDHAEAVAALQQRRPPKFTGH